MGSVVDDGRLSNTQRLTDGEWDKVDAKERMGWEMTGDEGGGWSGGKEK
jgi:hypothetical protein